MQETPALQQSALEQAGAIVTETSLSLSNPTGLTWEQYERLGNFLGTLGRAYCWWVGDFLIYGEDVFGEEFAQIEAQLPHSAQTLLNYRSIARHFPPRRRRQSLSFSVHEAVAYLEPTEGDRLLDLAEANGWKRDQMREARRAITPESKRTGVVPDPPPQPLLHCPACGHEGPAQIFSVLSSEEGKI